MQKKLIAGLVAVNLASCLAILVPGLAFARKDSQRAAVGVAKWERSKKGDADEPKHNANYYQTLAVGSRLEKKLIEGIDKTLVFLKKTAEQLPPRSAPRLVMLERILNLHMEQAAYVASGEQEAYDRNWRSWARAGRKGAQPQLDSRASSAQWQMIYHLSQAIQAEYPKGSNADRIGFNGALALQFLGKDQAAIQEFRKLTKRYPKSSVAGDAYFSLGEYYFDKHAMEEAFSAYNSAVQYKNSSRYGWSLFKLAWCHFNLGQYPQSLAAWQATVAFTERSEDQKAKRLKEEALRDMIFAFSELQKIDEAMVYYRKHGGEAFIPKFLKILAETLTNQGRYKQASDAWRQLLNHYPQSSEAFDAQSELVNLAYEQNNYQGLWIEEEKLYRGYNHQSKWAQRTAGEKVKEAQELIKKMILYYPKIIHQEAQKANTPQLFVEAQRGYLIFLKYYGSSFEVAEIKEYLGDIAFSQQKFDQAGKWYEQIAKLEKGKAAIFDDQGKVKEDIHARSAKNMLDAYNKYFLPELTALLKLTPDFRKPARALTARAKNFISGCANYKRWYPEDEKTLKNCEVFISEVYYRSQNKKMAQRYLWVLASKYPNEKEGVTAVENLIPMYEGDKKGLFSAATKLLTIPAYQRGKLGAKLRSLIDELELADIAAEPAGIKRAKRFEAYARKNPKGSEADKLWNNAAVDYLQAGAVEEAIKAFTMLVTGYPSSSVYAAASLQLGKLHEEVFVYDKASEHYLAFAKRSLEAKSSPKDSKAAAAWERSCELEIALAAGKELNLCLSFARAYPQGGAAALQKLIEALGRSQRYPELNQVVLQEYLPRFKLSANEKILAYYQLYRAKGANNAAREQAGQNIMKVAQQEGGVSGEALRYWGEVAFHAAQARHQQFMQGQLRGGDINALQGSIEALSTGLQGLEQVYERVFATQDSFWGVAAFYQLGLAYESFALKLADPPTVAGVSRAEMTEQLQASVDQVQGKAKEYYHSGLQTARQFSIYNDWSVQIFNALNRISQRKVSFAEIVVMPDFVGSQVPQRLPVQF